MAEESSSTSTPTLSWSGRAPLYAEDYSSLTDTQEKILALLPLIPCTLSIWGSANIIHMVWTSTKRTTPYRRILLALSVCDLINSTAYPFQSFLVPADTSQRVWAVGTDATCSMLGWFNHFHFTSIWYSGMISIYFLLTVRFGKTERWVAYRVEPFMHLLSIGWPLVTACIAAALNMYHEYLIGMGCWIYEYPEGCQDCAEFPDTERPCCEGSFWGWVFGALPTLGTLLVIGTSNTIIYCHVRSTIRKSEQYMNSSFIKRRKSQRINAQRCNHQAERIQAVATQALLYVGAFVITYACALSFKIMESLDYNAEDEDMLFPGLVVQQLTIPLLGFLNCLVFVRPSYMRVRKRHPNESRFWAFRRALHGDKIKTSSIHYQQRQRVRLSNPHHNNSHQPDNGCGGGGGGSAKGPSLHSLRPPLNCHDDQQQEESMLSFELDMPGCTGSSGNLRNSSHHSHRRHNNNNNNNSNITSNNDRYHHSAPEIFRGLADFSATNRYLFGDVLFDSTDLDDDDDYDEGEDDDGEGDENNYETEDLRMSMSMPNILSSTQNEKETPTLQERIYSAARRRRFSNGEPKSVPPIETAVVEMTTVPVPLDSNSTTLGHSTATTSSESSEKERRKNDSAMIPREPTQRQSKTEEDECSA